MLSANSSSWRGQPAAMTCFKTCCTRSMVVHDLVLRPIMTLFIADSPRGGFSSTRLTFQCPASSSWIISFAHSIIPSGLATTFSKSSALLGWVLRNLEFSVLVEASGTILVTVYRQCRQSRQRYQQKHGRTSRTG